MHARLQEPSVLAVVSNALYKAYVSAWLLVMVFYAHHHDVAKLNGKKIRRYPCSRGETYQLIVHDFLGVLMSSLCLSTIDCIVDKGQVGSNQSTGVFTDAATEERHSAVGTPLPVIQYLSDGFPHLMNFWKVQTVSTANRHPTVFSMSCLCCTFDSLAKHLSELLNLFKTCSTGALNSLTLQYLILLHRPI